MTTFRDREKQFEEKFRHDEELRFKVLARRDKLVGLWAAELMGIEGQEADAYAREVVRADLELPGDDDVIQKLMRDFGEQGVEMSEHRLRKKLDECFETAKGQMMSQ